MEKEFNPNVATFDQGVERIQEAIKESKTHVGRAIMTSQDEGAIKLVNLLATSNVPQGFKKWQLPFSFSRAQMFISVGGADSDVPEHSHDEGDGIRFIMSGSIYYNGKELKSGDWMYIPKGAKYSIKVGPMGASMCYCYECSCAPRPLWRGEAVINPGPLK